MWKESKYGVFSGPYSFQIWENTDQKKLCIWIPFAQWFTSARQYKMLLFNFKYSELRRKKNSSGDAIKLNDRNSDGELRFYFSLILNSFIRSKRLSWTIWSIFRKSFSMDLTLVMWQACCHEINQKSLLESFAVFS